MERTEDNKTPYVTGMSGSAIRQGDGIPMAADSQGLEDNKSRTLSPYVTTVTTLVSLPSGDRIVMAGDRRATRHGDGIPMAAADLRGLEENKSKTLSPYVTTGTTEVTLNCRDGTFMTKSKDQIVMGWLKDVIPMARCKDGIRTARCKDGIPMAAADSRGLEDNKSRTLSPCVTTGTTVSAIRHGDAMVMAVDGSMESLPSDVVQDIVSRVPAESVLECKLVCKKWEILIGQSNFANMHLSRLLNYLHGGDNDDDNDKLVTKVEPCLFFACGIEDPDIFKTLLFHGGQLSDRINDNEKYIYNENLKRIYHPPMHEDSMCNILVGSCNGLVCAFECHNLVMDPIYICNPLTREYVHLPELVVKKEDGDPDFLRIVEGEVDMYNKTACGFGYARSTNEYKVVRIHYLKYDVGNVEVYTLGSGFGWRDIGIVPYRLSMALGGSGTYVNDAIYWIVYNEIVAFDLAKEEFRLLSGPPCLKNRTNLDRCGLVALGGRLCFYLDKLRLEIWSLKESSDSKQTWNMEFDIDSEAAAQGRGTRRKRFQPILLTKNREVIFLYGSSVLYCYDKKTTLLKMISNEPSTDHLEKVEAIAHVNTFASLEALGENSKRYRVRPGKVHTPCDDVIDELSRVALEEEVDMTHFRLR